MRQVVTFREVLKHPLIVGIGSSKSGRRSSSTRTNANLTARSWRYFDRYHPCANKPIKDEAGSGNAMEGPFAKLDGLNVNREIMDDEKFDCFGEIHANTLEMHRQ
jgi:hypothetical protein